jgi:hypothetical protein
MSDESKIEWTEILIERFWSYVDQRGPDECWPWKAARFEKGYGQFRAGKRKVKAHRCALELTIGPLPEGFLSLHKCDNPPCCNPGHLFSGTTKANAEDRERKGRGSKAARPSLPGESNPAARLAESDVIEIRRQLGIKHCKEVAALFNVSPSTIRGIWKGETWASVQ